MFFLSLSPSLFILSSTGTAGSNPAPIPERLALRALSRPLPVLTIEKLPELPVTESGSFTAGLGAEH